VDADLSGHAVGIGEGAIVMADDSRIRAPTRHCQRLGLIGRGDDRLRVGESGKESRK
jgi:hypothetical protein